MKWYIFCILIGILLFLFVNNIDRFSIGVPSFFIIRTGPGVNPPSPEFISPDGNADNARVNYMNPTTGQIETLNFYEYMQRENQQARDNGQTLPYPDLGNFEIIQEAELEQQEVCATRGNLELRRIETPLPQTENDIDNNWIQLTPEQQQLIRELYMNSDLYQLVQSPPDQEVFFRDRLEGTGNPPRIFWNTITFGDQPIIIRGLDLYQRTLQLFDETVVSRFLWIMRIDSDFKTDPNLEPPPILVEEGIPPDPSVRSPDPIQIQSLYYADYLDWDDMDIDQQTILGHLGWDRDTWQAGNVRPFFIEEDIDPITINNLMRLGFSPDFIQDFEVLPIVEGQIVDVYTDFPVGSMLSIDSRDSTSRYNTWLIQYNIETGKIIHIRKVTSDNIFFDNPDVDQIRIIDSQDSNIQTYLVRSRTTRGVPGVSRYFLRNIDTATPYTFNLDNVPGMPVVDFNSTMVELNEEQRQYLIRLGFNGDFNQPIFQTFNTEDFTWLVDHNFDINWIARIRRGPIPGNAAAAAHGATVPGGGGVRPQPTGGGGPPTGGGGPPTGGGGGARPTTDGGNVIDRLQDQANYEVQRQREWNNLAITQQRTREMQEAFRSVYRNSNLYTRFISDIESAWDYVRGDIPDGSIRLRNGDPFRSTDMERLRAAGFTPGIINKFNHL